MAKDPPGTKADLQQVRGLGKKTLARYGAAILGILIPDRTAGSPDPPSPRATPSPRPALPNEALDPAEVVPLFAPSSLEVGPA
ncbi:MAG: HRDC domain-containing protein [Planctomycetes bacterium]|nr:HRDC domain-containing protein [Planctomycetota bacterium]